MNKRAFRLFWIATAALAQQCLNSPRQQSQTYTSFLSDISANCGNPPAPGFSQPGDTFSYSQGSIGGSCNIPYSVSNGTGLYWGGYSPVKFFTASGAYGTMDTCYASFATITDGNLSAHEEIFNGIAIHVPGTMPYIFYCGQNPTPQSADISCDYKIVDLESIACTPGLIYDAGLNWCCVAARGQACNSCGGTYDCNGNCPDCGGGGCAWNAGLSCNDCGMYACDGSCDTSGCNPGGGGGGPPDDPCASCTGECWTFWDPFWRREEVVCLQDADPILISLDGSNFPMTGAANGVLFDFFRHQTPLPISWTAPGAQVGWLALDLDWNGRITSGAELFSNVMLQPRTDGSPIGFKALAQWDAPKMGGNNDGWINAGDQVFRRLRVWVDANHNGISEPAELLTMQQAGITAISTRYLPDKWADQYGNKFTNRAQITWASTRPGKGQGDGGGRNQWAYDVTLVRGK